MVISLYNFNDARYPKLSTTTYFEKVSLCGTNFTCGIDETKIENPLMPGQNYQYDVCPEIYACDGISCGNKQVCLQDDPGCCPINQWVPAGEDNVGPQVPANSPIKVGYDKKNDSWSECCGDDDDEVLVENGPGPTKCCKDHYKDIPECAGKDRCAGKFLCIDINGDCVVDAIDPVTCATSYKEICGDGIDNDGDDEIDEGCEASIKGMVWIDSEDIITTRRLITREGPEGKLKRITAIIDVFRQS